MRKIKLMNMAKQDQKPSAENYLDSRNQKPTKYKAQSGQSSMQPKRQNNQRQNQTESQCANPIVN